MAFQAVPDTCLIEVIGTNNGETVENTFYARKSPIWTLAELATLASNVSNVIISDFLEFLPNSWLGVAVKCTNLNAEAALQVVDDEIAGEPGTGGINPLPNNVTFAIQRLSGFTGRNSRGRIFWMGMFDSMLSTNENRLSDAFANAMAACLTTLDASIVTSGGVPVIVSRYDNNTKRPVAITLPIVSWDYGDLTIDTRRSRLPD